MGHPFSRWDNSMFPSVALTVKYIAKPGLAARVEAAAGDSRVNRDVDHLSRPPFPLVGCHAVHRIGQHNVGKQLNRLK